MRGTCNNKNNQIYKVIDSNIKLYMYKNLQKNYALK